MNKTDLIRRVGGKHLHWSNQQIKDAIRQEYNQLVSSSAIINVLGSHRKRLEMSGYSVDLKKKAKEFLSLVGSYDQARNLLALAEANRA
ncbi:hypothetical protein [Neorhodopirellula lusitana]|uniref:hypothetical protein n=1 Tax=Neorhodopirellula lusitana TaxID=445327 RepID=UPI00384EEB97